MSRQLVYLNFVKRVEAVCVMPVVELDMFEQVTIVDLV